MKKILNWLFYAPRREKPTDKNIMSLILPSILGIFVCMICLVGLTVAWYTVNIESKPQEIVLANFHMEASVTDGDGEVKEKSGEFTLTKANTEYTVTLSNKGIGRGYAVIQIDGDTYYTDIIDGDKELAFTITVHVDSEPAVEAQAAADKGEVEGEETEAEEAKVQEAEVDIELQNPVKVTVTAHWGAYSDKKITHPIENGDSFNFKMDSNGKLSIN